MSEIATTVGNAQTRITDQLAKGDLIALAECIEDRPIPLSYVALNQVCAMLCRRIAALEANPKETA